MFSLARLFVVLLPSSAFNIFIHCLYYFTAKSLLSRLDGSWTDHMEVTGAWNFKAPCSMAGEAYTPAVSIFWLARMYCHLPRTKRLNPQNMVY
jgi:hypothetical protein